MTLSTRYRWGSAAALTAGVSGAALTMIGQIQPPVPFWLSIVSLLASLAALTAIHDFQKARAGNLGLAGFILAVTGSLLLNLNILIELTGMVYALGLILMASASLRAGTFPRWVPWMWFASPLLGFSGVLLAGLDMLFFTLGSIAFGVGFIGFGLTLWNAGE